MTLEDFERYRNAIINHTFTQEMREEVMRQWVKDRQALAQALRNMQQENSEADETNE